MLSVKYLHTGLNKENMRMAKILISGGHFLVMLILQSCVSLRILTISRSSLPSYSNNFNIISFLMALTLL